MSGSNILVVMADQLTAMVLACHGHPLAHTPNLDKLAARGVAFNAAYSSSPLCTPARYAFMTGQFASRSGGYDNAAFMPATMPTLAHYLRLMGYHTCLAGKMHFVGPDQLHGFEQRVTTDVYPADFGWVPDWTQPEERIDLWYHNMSSVKQAGVAAISNQLAYDEEVGGQAMRAIYNHARSSDERPMCLVASFIHPHDPYAARQRYWDLYDADDVPMPNVTHADPSTRDAHTLRLRTAIEADVVPVSDGEVRAARHAYLANVSYVDGWLGKLCGALDECGMAEDTTVVVTSDHGDMLGERGLWYKMSFHEWSCRIPLIISNPSRLSARTVSQPVSQVDVLPTLLDIAHGATGAQIPDVIDPLDGRSLWPLCHGDSAADPGLTTSEYLAEGTGSPMLMLREGPLKYIQCAGDPELMFNLEDDPDELHSLVGQAAAQDSLARFRQLAAAHWDPDAVKQQVIADQQRRRAVHAALRIGTYHSWDYQPPRDASTEYTRSHMDLTEFDVNSRFPRPVSYQK